MNFHSISSFIMQRVESKANVQHNPQKMPAMSDPNFIRQKIFTTNKVYFEDLFFPCHIMKTLWKLFNTCLVAQSNQSSIFKKYYLLLGWCHTYCFRFLTKAFFGRGPKNTTVRFFFPNAACCTSGIFSGSMWSFIPIDLHCSFSLLKKINVNVCCVFCCGFCAIYFPMTNHVI